MRCSQEEAHLYAVYLDGPEGLGITSEEQAEHNVSLFSRGDYGLRYVSAFCLSGDREVVISRGG